MDFLKDSTWLWRLVMLVLVIIWICVPGTTASLFNGLPLSAYEGLIALSLVILTFVIPWQKISRIRWFIIASLISLIIVQLWGASSLHYGWSVCLRRLVKPETISTPCEPTAEFKSGQRSYIFPTITWTRNQLPLYFMNDKQAFNFYQDDEPSRSRLPYHLIVSSFIMGGDNQSISINTWNPAATLTIDDNSHTFVKDQTLTIPLPEKRPYKVTFESKYARANEDELLIKTTGNAWHELRNNSAPSPWIVTLYRMIDYALLTLLLLLFIGTAGRSLGNKLSTSSKWGCSLIITYLMVTGLITQEIWLVALLVLFLLTGLWFARSPEDKWAMLPALVVLGFQTMRTIGQGNWSLEDTRIYEFIFLPLLIWISWYFLTRPETERKYLLPWVLLLLLVVSFHFISHTYPPGFLVLFDGGGDELTHEGFARQVMLARNTSDYLINGENHVFYYQPLYRYFLAAFHQFWGEAMFGAYVIQTWLMSLAILAGLHFLRLMRLSAAPIAMTLAIGAVSLRGEHTFFTITQNAWQQGLSMPLLLLAIFLTCIMLIKPQMVRISAIFGISLLWGLIFAIRTDYVPMAAVTLLAFCLLLKPKPTKQRLHYIILMAIGLIIFPSLVVARNYVVAHELAFMPTSGLYNIIPPLDGVFANQDLRSISSLKALFQIIQHYRSSLTELFSILWDNVTHHFMGKTLAAQILWYTVPFVIGVNIIYLRSRLRLITILLFLWPFMQLLPAVFFVQHNLNAMVAHYDYLWLTLLAITIGALVNYHQRKNNLKTVP